MIKSAHPIPETITLHKRSALLELEYASGERFILPCAYLRAFSTSAEMRQGFTVSREVLQTVTILSLEPVGHYAIKPIFSDGHATGIFSFDQLYELGIHKERNWPT
jgi:DUF971 family protein